MIGTLWQSVMFAAIYYITMTHILDNPIYNALKTGNKHLAANAGQVSLFRRDVAPFAGMEYNTEADFEAISALSADTNPLVIFTPVKLTLPKTWNIVYEFDMKQMVYEGPMPPMQTDVTITELSDNHISEMIALTTLTKPGPFLQRTIEFGGYTGIYENGELVAMAGQRMQPLPYVEISAVCTHPDHVGKGYAGILLNEQIRRIMASGKLPFLHVLADNPAIRVYEHVGFKTRKPIFGYVCNLPE
jgi:ribosomal protein S18 acetylase RimI-like enzyme